MTSSDEAMCLAYGGAGAASRPAGSPTTRAQTIHTAVGSGVAIG
ncbi:hypothetical protein [Dokdonella soli]